MREQIVRQRILTADEGKFLTDGETYAKTVVIPMDADAYQWKEVTEDQLPKEEENTYV